MFTHHTQYDKYAHYLGGENSQLAKRFINELDIGYCNLCDAVIAPSQSVADDLVARGLSKPPEVIPTGINPQWWASESRSPFRVNHHIPANAFVVGHVGRLAKEKNLPFLAKAVALLLSAQPDAWFVVAGVGPCEKDILQACREKGVEERYLNFGVLEPEKLRELYRSLDVFVFASKSETQGIVLAEAMAAGAPVVAIDAPGVREIVADQVNGRLLNDENINTFADAVHWVANLDERSRAVVQRELRETVNRYSLDQSVGKLVGLYQWATEVKRVGHSTEHEDWNALVNRAEEEVKIWSNFAHAIGEAIAGAIRSKMLV